MIWGAWEQGCKITLTGGRNYQGGSYCLSLAIFQPFYWKGYKIYIYKV